MEINDDDNVNFLTVSTLRKSDGGSRSYDVIGTKNISLLPHKTKFQSKESASVQ
jgi:hypothetical protein